MTDLNEWGLSQAAATTTTPPSTTTTALVGAGLGAVVGAGVGHALGKHTATGAVVGAVAGGGAGYYYGTTQQPAALPAPGLSAGQSINPLLEGPSTATVSQQGGKLSVTLDPKATLGTVSLAVPATGTTSSATYQVSGSNAPATSSPSPASGSLLTGVNTLTINWTTAAGVAVVSTVTVTVA